MREGFAVELINTDEMAVLGPGSEWFWTMLQFVVVTVTLLGLYRQLRAQNSANVLQRMEALQGRWEAPLMIHARLVIALWRKHGAAEAPDYSSQAALNWVLGFFEDLATLEEDRHITWPEIEPSWGLALVEYWMLAGPAVQALRSGTSSETFAGFERLARRAEAVAQARGEDWSISEADVPALIERRIGRDTARLGMLRAVETGVLPTDTPVSEDAVASGLS